VVIIIRLHRSRMWRVGWFRNRDDASVQPHLAQYPNPRASEEPFARRCGTSVGPE
jgi:hypothetical protein